MVTKLLTFRNQLLGRGIAKIDINARMRLHEETAQLRDRIAKLDMFIGQSRIFKTLCIEDQSDLMEQLGYMESYHAVLSRRISRLAKVHEHQGGTVKYDYVASCDKCGQDFMFSTSKKRDAWLVEHDLEHYDYILFLRKEKGVK